jgi:hypothetical protein
MIPEPYNYILAAFGLDFEGSIGLSLSKTVHETYSFRPTVRVHNSSLKLLKAFEVRIGFGYVNPNPSASSDVQSPMYTWRMQSKTIREVMPKIIPHLTLKREQGELLLEAFQYINPRGTKIRYTRNSDSRTQSLLEIYRKLAYLNEKPFRKQPELTDAEKLLKAFRQRGIR